MNYPEFFNTIETITLQDPLSNLLGTFENGQVEFSYLDVVKNAGHSCPTVAGAYLLALEGLKELYPNETPTRGEIFVAFKEDSSEGVAGVIANVLSHITGATETFGFKGLNGNFARHDLMQFNDTINSSIKLQRLDTGKTVELVYNPSSIEQNPQVMPLMQKIMQNNATAQDKKLFGALWQERVENIFNNIPKVITVVK
jgi:hypothetical protein